MVRTALFVFLGGGLGSVARLAVSLWMARVAGESFPWGTVLVNVTGSFIIGFLATIFGADGRFLVDPDIRQFLLTGFLGGFTTFSSFSLQTLTLAQAGQWGAAAGNCFASLLLCLLAVWLGYLSGAFINQLR